MTVMQIVSPAILPFGAVRLQTEDGIRTCLVGIAGQYPNTRIDAQSHNKLVVSGARADLALQIAEQFRVDRKLKSGAIVEVDLAITTGIGHGSDAMLGLTTAAALAWCNDEPYKDTAALGRTLRLPPSTTLALWAFDRGGFLVVDPQALPEKAIVHRYEISQKDRYAWAFVLIHLRGEDLDPNKTEADYLDEILAAGERLDETESTAVLQKIEAAISADDFEAFCAGLSDLQQMNFAALAAAGTPRSNTELEEKLFEAAAESGSLATGKLVSAPTPFALVRGELAVQDVRLPWGKIVGWEGGAVFATITNNTGATYEAKDDVKLQASYGSTVRT